MARSLNQGLNQSLKAAPTTKRLNMALMGGAGLILLGGGGALVGLNSHLTSLQTTAQEKQSEVGSSEDITKRYETTQAAYTETQSRMQYLEASVSAKSYVPTLLGQLQTLAAQTHLTVTSVRPTAVAPTAPARAASGDGGADKDLKKAPPPPAYDTLNIDVNVTGTYADTATFLYDLTKFPKIISLVGAQMHPNGVPPGTSPYASPAVTTDLKLVAFMFHDDGADTSAAPSAALAQSAPPTGRMPGATMPLEAVGKISPVAGHVAASAVGATKAMNERAAVGVGTL